MESQDRAQHMVEVYLAGRGIRDPRVLEAMRRVPREAFVPADLADQAYEDSPLPIEAGQTISQPYIVALMMEALRLEPGDRVLEVGAGSGYAAAVAGAIAAEVWAIERHEVLARQAAARMAQLGYRNVHVRHGDGTLGLAEQAPFDAILVSAGGPRVPPALLAQLAEGGRLLIPVGRSLRDQELVRVTRVSPSELREERLGAVRFVPLVGEGGWAPEPEIAVPPGRREGAHAVAALIRECAEPIAGIDEVDLSGLLERIGDARVVLLGEATHGTSEFYRMRARITRELVVRRGFDVVAVEADWPDAAQIDHHVRRLAVPPAEHRAFTRFPTWMWRNRETAELVAWLRARNELAGARSRPVSFHGLDLYSLYTSIDRVLAYLADVDPALARRARERYAVLLRWDDDPAVYGRAVLDGRLASCENEVVAMLQDLLVRRVELAARRGDGERFFDAARNAALVAAAERYYRAMYRGARTSWNLRDTHMFETLQAVLAHRGPESRAIVWAHNSHVGDAAATEMGARGEINIGHLCRRHFGDQAYVIGFGTHRGTVAAAHDWGEPMQVMRVRPSHGESYERLFHDSGVAALLLSLRAPRRTAVRAELGVARLERAIGVIYRPDTELQSHYFQAVLPVQLDEYVWFDETNAVTPLPAAAPSGEARESHPFGF